MTIALNWAKLATLIYGARTQGAVASAAKAGFGFIGGDAVATPLEKPRAAYPLNPLADRQPTAAS